MLVGHNIAAYDLAVLLQRLSANKVAQWSKVGRMRIKTMPRLSGNNSAFSGSNWAEWSVVAGRLMCDTYLSARELLPSQRSYGLKELARVQLGANKPEVDPAQLLGMFDETSSLLSLVRCTENDAFLSLQLMFKMMVLPLTKQLTNLAGNLWTKSLQGKRAERIEYLLLHEFHKLKYIKPDKESYKQKMAKRAAGKGADKPGAAKSADADADDDDGPHPPLAAHEADDDDDGGRRGVGQSGRKKPAYAGGLVLEPKRGFYDKFVPPPAMLPARRLLPRPTPAGLSACTQRLARPRDPRPGSCCCSTSTRCTRRSCRSTTSASRRSSGPPPTRRAICRSLSCRPPRSRRACCHD